VSKNSIFFKNGAVDFVGGIVCIFYVFR